MVWLVVFLVAAPVIVGFWLARQMNVRPDDALAMRLASELGTPPPTFDTSKRAWRIELEGTELWVGAHHLSATRAIERAVGEPFTVLDGPLGGREQEEYRLSRVLVPDGEGGWCVGGRSDALTAQEERVVATRPAGLPWLRVDVGTIAAGTHFEPQADDARALVAALAAIAHVL
ncbi:MAG: hypothetical protein R3B99_14105 [Polyangiales bacterium]|nr:hypothetical protein [Myxococcales bacterium]